MTPIISLVVACIGAVGSILAAAIAHRAQRNTKPLSNGFASDVTRRLGKIEKLITHHIQEHADADLRKPRSKA